MRAPDRPAAPEAGPRRASAGPTRRPGGRTAESQRRPDPPAGSAGPEAGPAARPQAGGRPRAGRPRLLHHTYGATPPVGVALTVAAPASTRVVLRTVFLGACTAFLGTTGVVTSVAEYWTRVAT